MEKTFSLEVRDAAGLGSYNRLLQATLTLRERPQDYPEFAYVTVQGLNAAGDVSLLLERSDECAYWVRATATLDVGTGALRLDQSLYEPPTAADMQLFGEAIARLVDALRTGAPPYTPNLPTLPFAVAASLEAAAVAQARRRKGGGGVRSGARVFAGPLTVSVQWFTPGLGLVLTAQRAARPAVALEVYRQREPRRGSMLGTQRPDGTIVWLGEPVLRDWLLGDDGVAMRLDQMRLWADEFLRSDRRGAYAVTP